ncbi:MAG: AMP-binding protein [Clostridium sp.]|nr:AMP-binding protein [Clostridium sp.]
MTYEEFERKWADESPCIIAHTSGSTGTPKEIRLLKADMLASAKATNARFGITKESVLGIPLSCDYIAGKMMAVRAYAAGCKLKVIPPKNDFEIGVGRIDLLSIVPSQADCLIRHPEWSNRIGAVIVGGAALSQEKWEALARTGYKAYASYGMTETCSHVALAEMGGPFTAMPGITFGIDARGCLTINIPTMSIGQVTTNDIVDLLDERSFIWQGRYDNVINSGGIKIFPEQLEKEIAKYLNIDFYIVGIPDEKWGEATQMVAQGNESMRPAIEEALKNSLDHKNLPKNIHFVRMLPRTANGKLLRKAYY